MTTESTIELENEQPTRHHGDDILHYAGFWRRFGAYWLDFVIFLPFAGLSCWVNEIHRLALFYTFVPGLIVSLWFHVYLVKRYGGTPGKLLLKTSITRLDGASVGYREALLRYSVIIVLSTLLSIALMTAITHMTDAEYLSLGFKDRSLRMVALAPGWYHPLYLLLNIWIWSEFIVMLTNKRRRALHDFIAGTVVIRNRVTKQDHTQS